MPTCTNKLCLCGHNFGGCLARITTTGAIDISSYTRFQHTGPRWCPTSSARAAEPTGPSVPSGARTWQVRTWHAQRPTTRSRAATRPAHAHEELPTPALSAGMSRSPAPPSPNYAGHERARQTKTSKWLIKRIKQLSSRMHGAATTTHHWMSGARSRTTYLEVADIKNSFSVCVLPLYWDSDFWSAVCDVA
jgi:hypothetical protein